MVGAVATAVAFDLAQGREHAEGGCVDPKR